MDNTEKQYDVYGVGNALVDLEIQVDDDFLMSRGLQKGIMSLVSSDEQALALNALDGRPREQAAGGSAANTMVGVALAGGAAFYSGKVGSDDAGALYRRSMAQAGVEFEVEAGSGPTGTCLVMVTPDGERTMQSHLGSSTLLAPGDIQTARIARSRMVYVEGYLWGGPGTTATARHAMDTARAGGVPVAFTLSDPNLVHAVGDQLRAITQEQVEVLFCNEYEAQVYTGARNREMALQGLGGDAPLVFMTCGADGSMVYDRGAIHFISGHRVNAVDSTGAGDSYAAGVLYGLTHGMTPQQAGVLGSFLSAKVVTHFGPRPTESLAHRMSAILEGAHPMD